jgi:uncharacterized membrane protein
VLVAHDSSSLAWIVVAAYFCAALLTVLAARGAAGRREKLFWTGCAALLVLLGLNKQLDLQTAITEVGRSIARQEGWFEYRRLVQTVFVLVLGTGAAGALIILAIWLRSSGRAVRLAALGLVLLMAFILLRAASFHHMDAWVTRTIAGLRSGWWLELAGILVIGISALADSRRNRAAAG